MDVVQKIWDFCNVLKHDGINYGDYIEPLTHLPFFTLAEEKWLSLPDHSSPSLREMANNQVCWAESLQVCFRSYARQ